MGGVITGGVDGAVAAMLGARSVAVVGASAVPDSFGGRMVTEVLRSTGLDDVHLVNPRYAQIDGRRCLPDLAAIGAPVDLVLLGVADRHLAGQLRIAAELGARSAVVYGSAHRPGLRAELTAIATGAGMALCGPGCMGFLNAQKGIRAVGYLERDPRSVADIALVTHSGSVFSTLLRAERGFGFGLAISSGQELVTGTAAYLEYVLEHTPSRAIALVLETVREGPRLRAALRRAAEQDVPVVLLPVGTSGPGSSLVAAHSGALAGAGATWEALCTDTGALSVADLAELADTLELLAPGRRARAGATGIATVHDSGAERALTADIADGLGVPFASLGTATLSRLANLLDDGLTPANPLDVWGTGADTRALFTGCLEAMLDDDAVGVLALAVDLVPEYDGDTSYPDAVLAAAATTTKPVAVLAGLPSALDPAAATRLRAAGVPVLEGLRGGLVAMRNLLSLNGSQWPRDDPEIDRARQERWMARLRDPAPWAGAESFALLADYGVGVVEVVSAADEAEAVRVASRLGLPVVLKTDEPGLAHKSDAGGVLLGVQDVAAAYRTLNAGFGPRVLVSRQVGNGVELAIGLVRDPQLGPMVVIGAGGRLVELIGDRVVGLPPLGRSQIHAMLGRLRIAPLLNGFRGRPVDQEDLVDSVLGLCGLAIELGDEIEALDINPIIAGPGGAVAVDVLVEPRPLDRGMPAPGQKMA